MSLWWWAPLGVGAAGAAALAVVTHRLAAAAADLRPLTRDLNASTDALRRTRHARLARPGDPPRGSGQGAAPVE